MFCDLCSCPKKTVDIYFGAPSLSIKRNFLGVFPSLSVVLAFLLMCYYSCADTSIGIPSIGHGVPKTSWRRRTHFERLYFSDDLKTHGLSMCQLPNQFHSNEKQCFRSEISQTSREANLRPGEVDTMTRRSGREGWEELDTVPKLNMASWKITRFSIGNTSSKGGFSIAIFVSRRGVKHCFCFSRVFVKHVSVDTPLGGMPTA